MSEYLGQILSFQCVEQNSFEVKILIDTRDNFYKIMDFFNGENLSDYTTYNISIVYSQNEEILMTPDENANECMSIYADNLLEDVVGTESEVLWQKGSIIDNLVYDIINSPLLRPLSTKDIEIGDDD